MSLHDPFFTKFDGSPDVGRVPVRLIVGGSGSLTGPQLRGVEHVYHQFKNACKLSVSDFHTEFIKLNDGTRVWLWSLQGRDEITALPSAEIADDEQEISAVGYSAGLDSRYLPIYDRTVIDHADEIIPLLEYPPEPEYPPPPQYPEGPYFFIGYGVTLEEIRIVSTGLEWPEPMFEAVPVPDDWKVRAYLVIDGVATPIPNVVIRHPFTDIYGGWMPSELHRYEFRCAASSAGPFDNPVDGSLPQGVRCGVPMSEENITAYLAEHPDTPNPDVFGRAHVYHWDGSTETVTESYDPWPDTAYRSAYASWASGLAATQAAWQAEVDQLRNPWLAACAAIDVQNAAIEAANDVIRNTVFPGITSTRIAGRAAQISAIRSMLSGGIGLPTLTAKILSFPYSVGFTAAGDATVPPDFYEFPPFHEDGTISFSDKWSTSPTRSLSFGTHLCDPYCIFGWTASGSASRGEMWAGGPGTYEIKGLDASIFSPRSGYADFVDAGLTIYPGSDGRMNSDAFVPPGTVVTTVLLEYDCFDPFTGEWMWTPSVDTLTANDAIWIKSLGGYRDQEWFTPEEDSPRSVRTWKAIRQTRGTDWSWSAPEQIVEGDENSLPWSGGVTPYWSYWGGGEGGGEYPSLVVIVENLPKESMPIPDGDFGAGNVVWSAMESYSELFNRPWDGEGTLEDLIMNVMKALLGGQEP
jgi:hypothetical protein